MEEMHIEFVKSCIFDRLTIYDGNTKDHDILFGPKCGSLTRNQTKLEKIYILLLLQSVIYIYIHNYILLKIVLCMFNYNNFIYRDVILSSGNQMLVVFKTDSSIASKGFKLTYKEES